jgi:hypothetical protein
MEFPALKHPGHQLRRAGRNPGPFSLEENMKDITAPQIAGRLSRQGVTVVILPGTSTWTAADEDADGIREIAYHLNQPKPQPTTVKAFFNLGKGFWRLVLISRKINGGLAYSEIGPHADAPGKL